MYPRRGGNRPLAHHNLEVFVTNTIFTKNDFDLDAAFESTAQLKQLETELNALFPEREFLIHQMILAVLMRMNVLIYGTYGTGKSELINTFIRAMGLPDSELFQIAMTRYTTESDVFGPIDVPKLREEGVQLRNPKGTIRAAKYANLEELFDNPQLLRSLLGVLNERFYSRGADSEPVPLRTAFASTNVAPKELLKEFPKADAIIDRFLFRCVTQWLQQDESLMDMFDHFLGGKTPTTQVDHDKLLVAAHVVGSPTDQFDREFLTVYLRVIKAIREHWGTHDGWLKFSDRTFCLWLEVLEASALLDGRYEVTLEDLFTLRYVACDGSPEQDKAFDTNIKPIIQKAIDEAAAMGVDDAIKLAMKGVTTQLATIPTVIADADLVSTRRKLVKILADVDTMKPTMTVTQTAVKSLRDEIAGQIARIDAQINSTK